MGNDKFSIVYEVTAVSRATKGYGEDKVATGFDITLEHIHEGNTIEATIVVPRSAGHPLIGDYMRIDLDWSPSWNQTPDGYTTP